jgi:Fur family ferric uptake transcriptional regulator
MESSHRNTKQKQLILAILKASDRPISINDIYKELVKDLPKIAKSTIYRNIDILVNQKLIDKYHFNDNEFFYLIRSDLNTHRHFVICDDCKKIFDLPSCTIHEIESTLEKEGFTVKEHQIQINGICKDCAKSTKKKQG